METTDLIKQAVATTGKVTAGLSTDQRSNATPCSEFDVHGLAAHMAGFFAGSAVAAAKGERPTIEDREAWASGLLGNDPAAALTDLGSKMADAWNAHGALDGSTQFGPGEMAAEMAGTITYFETLMHGWDLAKATGQAFEVSSELAEASLATAQKICNDQSRERGAFGAAVTGHGDSSAFDQALAMSGRDPGWSA